MPKKKRKTAKRRKKSVRKAKKPVFYVDYKQSQDLVKVAAVVLVLVIIGYLYMSNISKPSDVTNDAKAAVKLQLTEITHEDCATNKCFKLDSLESAIKKMSEEVEFEEKTVIYGSDDAQKLIEKYNIKRLPTLIISGDTDKIQNLEEEWLKLKLGTKEEDALVLRNIPNVAFDVDENKFIGQVKMITLTFNECSQCSNPATPESFSLLMPPVTIVENKKIDVSSDEGKLLLQKYNITAVPTIILSPEIKQYPTTFSNLQELGTEEKDGYFVFRERGLKPLYFSIKEQRLVGYVNAFYVVDSSCKECPNPIDLNKALNKVFGFELKETKLVDVQDAQNMETVTGWGIERVPAVIYVGDVNAYYAVSQLWSKLGFISGNKYILTNLDFIQNITYKDLNKEAAKNHEVDIGEVVVNSQ